MSANAQLRETSAATTGLLLRYARSRGGAEAVDAVLARSGVPYTEQELSDESRWFSYADRIALFEALVAVLEDDDATYELGASAARNGLNPSLVLVIRALGSPRQVFRQLPRAVAKFSTTSTMDVLDAGETHAVIRYRLHEGFEHSRLDCRYAQGLFTAVPTVFGLPSARVLHEECESDGHAACLYHVTWDRRRRGVFGRRREVPDRAELTALRGQLQALQLAASDLVGSDDLTVALQKVVTRAGAAVVAPAYLCVVESPVGGEPLVHSEGLAPQDAARIAARLRDAADLGPNAVVVEVATARRHHGRLAAIYPEGQRGPAGERDLLQAYAGHAAAALEQLVALEASRRGEARSKALLTLAHELAAATDDEAVAQTVASALPHIVGSPRASVMTWDPTAGELRATAAAGLTAAETAALLATPIRPDDVPELVEMLARREPTILDAESASPTLRQLLPAVGAERVIAVPLVASDELLGVATVGWSRIEDQLTGEDVEVIERLMGVADQAASAFQSARLLSAVRHTSLHDALTGLPNRVLFARRLDEALRTTLHEGAVAVLFCDLDRFKAINDSFGHAAGDELLRQVAARLRQIVRPEDLVARLSGDEFALVVRVEDVAAAVTVAERATECFERPFRLEGRELRVTTSVGVAVQRGPGGDGDRLLRAADGAMYEAKQRGRNQVATAEASAAPLVGGVLGDELLAAIEEGQLRLRFQPVVDVGTSYRAPERGEGETFDARVVGTEVFVRWEHPRLGLLSPGAFLPIAEERGMAVDLDLWVLRHAVARFAACPDDGDEPTYLAVNLTVATLLDERLLPAVRAARTEHGLASGQLVLEVIESRALIDLPGVIDRLVELRRMGIRVSLDDFGTGFSTLSWLLQLPIDQIKIDRTFVAPLPQDAAAVALVRGVVALARELRIDVVAEGVEEPAQVHALREAGCDRLQGYLFGRPAEEPPSGWLLGTEARTS